MQRRRFLEQAVVGGAGIGAATSLTTSAIAEDLPAINWRMASSFPKSLDNDLRCCGARRQAHR